MPIYKDSNTNTWYVKCYYRDYTGTRKQKLKRGFKLQREAKEWESDFLAKYAGQPGISFEALAAVYLEDQKKNVKQSTYTTSEAIIKNWLLPYFGDRAVDQITAADVRQWQNYLKEATGNNGKPLSASFMQTVHSRCSAIFNYAVKYYNLSTNPCKKAGNSFDKPQKRMNFWTHSQFNAFISLCEPSEEYYAVFNLLYYTGLRIGELQALTVSDIDLNNNTLSVSKTCYRIKGKYVITTPKTPGSNRTVTMPPFLADILGEYISRIYKPSPDTRLFSRSQFTYRQKLKEHSDLAGLPRIRLHDLRHSHASLLIELGFSALLISERLGHENVSTTLNIYAHLFPSKQSEVADKLQALHTQQ